MITITLRKWLDPTSCVYDIEYEMACGLMSRSTVVNDPRPYVAELRAKGKAFDVRFSSELGAQQAVVFARDAARRKRARTGKA